MEALFSRILLIPIQIITFFSGQRIILALFRHGSPKLSKCPAQRGMSLICGFQNDFGANLEYLLSHTNQSAKPTELKMIFLTFKRRLVFPFDILYFECAHRRIGDSIFAGQSALKCV